MIISHHSMHHHIWNDIGFARFVKGARQGGLEISPSRRFFAEITPRNCLKFMFTPSLPIHAGCQIDFSRNHAIIFIQFTFSRSDVQ